ncbi:hypothetical protein FN846DRAFT_908646 [Sphaerosporella brunnea]|uniref:Uncharacterized protein n=1 Tax=Sphaerosporella brunnea TaxID=1250544 RepID=A0A5J5ET42_9PEZI|nr:hypothetical protein FN846DRAFT_908646 [Sphaerosporella brunnea]
MSPLTTRSNMHPSPLLSALLTLSLSLAAASAIPRTPPSFSLHKRQTPPDGCHHHHDAAHNAYGESSGESSDRSPGGYPVRDAAMNAGGESSGESLPGVDAGDVHEEEGGVSLGQGFEAYSGGSSDLTSGELLEVHNPGPGEGGLADGAGVPVDRRMEYTVLDEAGMVQLGVDVTAAPPPPLSLAAIATPRRYGVPVVFFDEGLEVFDEPPR